MAMLMGSITAEQRRALSPVQLAERIDQFFKLEEFNRYGREPWPSNPTAVTIQLSPAVRSMNEGDQCRALQLYFRSKFQVSLCMTYGGIENHDLHNGPGLVKWADPRNQVINAAVRQSMLIAARIAFECLMEFIYLVEKRVLLPNSKKSKLGTFRKWCCEANNRYGWMVFFVMVVYFHDRDHRTPEVHGTSYVAIEALQCNEWPREDSELDLLNVMQNIWPLVLAVLEGRPVTHAVRGPRHDEIFEDFPKWSEMDLSARWTAFTQKFDSDSEGANTRR